MAHGRKTVNGVQPTPEVNAFLGVFSGSLETSALLKSVTDTLPIGFYVVDVRSERIVYFNDRFCDIWGLGHLKEKMQEGSINNRDVAPEMVRKIDGARTRPYPSPPDARPENATVHELYLADGRVIRRFTAGISLASGSCLGSLYAFEDITESKFSEEEVDKSNERYKVLIDSLPQIVYEMDLQGNLTFVNRSAFTVMGYSESDFAGGLNALDMVVPEDRVRAQENMSRAMSSQVSGSEYTFIRRDGSRFPVILHSRPIYRDGELVGLGGIVFDISERQRAVEELRKLSAAIEQSPSSVMIFDMDGRIVYVNPRFSKITGLSSEEVMGKSLFELYFPNADPGQFNDLTRAIESRQEWHGEIEYVKKSGRSSWVSAYIFPIKDDQGKITYFIDVEEDITERKLAEGKLRNLSMALDQSPVSVTIADCEGVIIYVNPSFTRLTGLDPGDVIGNRKINFLQQSTPGRVNSIFAAVKAGNPWESERRFVRKDGRECWVAVLISPVRDTKGEVTHFVIIEADITERKQSEDELRKLSAAVEQSPAAVKIVDRSGKINYVNPKFTEMSGYGPDEAIGRPSREMPGSNLDNRSILQMLDAIRAEKDWHGELLYKKKSGELFWVHSQVSPIRDDSGTVRHFIEISEDITERKRAEERLISSLREKEILLKEVHHRVKNNLQIISSLLNLQLSEIDRKPVENILRESQDRIRSIALVHERVYMSDDMARIDFRDYLASLSDSLLYTYAANTRHVSLSIHGDRILLGVDQAVPCGLIMNELISNCLKHAFPHPRCGTIRIELCGGARNVIVIEDDGVGMPENFSLASSRSMGMQLVTGLADQLDGTITLDRSGRTRFTITFPAAGKKA